MPYEVGAVFIGKPTAYSLRFWGIPDLDSMRIFEGRSLGGSDDRGSELLGGQGIGSPMLNPRLGKGE